MEKIGTKFQNSFNKKENNDNEDIIELLKDYDMDENEENGKRNIENIKVKEIEKENFIEKNDKDCVEYELSKDQNYILCTKYE